MVTLIFNYRSKFVEIDSKLLSQKFKVLEHDLYVEGFFRSFKKILNSKVVVFWFINYKTLPILLFSKLLNKKICIISGGYDISNINGYGMFSTVYGAVNQKIQLFFSDLIMVNSKSSYLEILERFTNIKNKLFWVYHALDNIPFKLNKNYRNIDFITIGTVKKVNMRRKGLSTFIEFAKKYPQKVFYLIGPVIDKDLLKLFPPNIKITGFISEDKKNELLENSKYYIQDSEHEGFGLSVLEAQFYGCHILFNPVYALNETVLYGTSLHDNFIFDENFKTQNNIKKLDSTFSLLKRKHALDSLINLEI